MNRITANSIGPIARGSLRVQSDARLVRLFRRGVEPAFDELVRRYRAALVNYAGSIAGHDRAEDVVQDALVKAHRSLSGDQPIELKPWMYTVVRNTALNDIRDNRKHRHDDLGESGGRASQTHDVVEQREHFAAVLAAVSDLPDAQRRALVDHELGGFSHEEIAAELDLSTGAAKQLIYRARLTLRDATGALIPVPLIAWLAGGSSGVVAAGTATGVAAGGTLGAASSGGAVGAAGSGGLLAGIAGAGTTKLAVVAMVAGGSLAAGVATERQQDRHTTPAAATTSAVKEPDSGGGSGSSGASMQFAADLERADSSGADAGNMSAQKIDSPESGDPQSRQWGDRDSSGTGSPERNARGDHENEGGKPGEPSRPPSGVTFHETRPIGSGGGPRPMSRPKDPANVSNSGGSGESGGSGSGGPHGGPGKPSGPDDGSDGGEMESPPSPSPVAEQQSGHADPGSSGQGTD